MKPVAKEDIMAFRYPAFIETDGDEIVIRFHDLPEIFCSGLDVEEAIFNATEALSDRLTRGIDRGHEVPLPAPNIDGAMHIVPNAVVQSVLERYIRSRHALDR